MIQIDTQISNTSFTDGGLPDLDIVELRRLLVDLCEKRPDILVRYRLIGHMWLPNFVTVTQVTEEEVIFSDAKGLITKRVHLQDLMQIELEGSFQMYRPYTHYTIRLISQRPVQTLPISDLRRPSGKEDGQVII
jgi:hypothetical protein